MSIQMCFKCELILCFSLLNFWSLFLFCSFCSFSVGISKMCYFYNIAPIVNSCHSLEAWKFR